MPLSFLGDEDCFAAVFAADVVFVATAVFEFVLFCFDSFDVPLFRVFSAVFAPDIADVNAVVVLAAEDLLPDRAACITSCETFAETLSILPEKSLKYSLARTISPILSHLLFAVICFV